MFLGKYDGREVAIKKLKIGSDPDSDASEVTLFFVFLFFSFSSSVLSILSVFSVFSISRPSSSSHSHILSQISRGFREFRQEITIMAALCHQNVVNLLAVCMNPFCLVCEFVPCGTLYDFIHDYEVPPIPSSPLRLTDFSQKPLPWKLRHKISVDLARGIQYMHDLNPPIVHIDMKTPNIMMMVPINLTSPPPPSSLFSLPLSLSLPVP